MELAQQFPLAGLSQEPYVPALLLVFAIGGLSLTLGRLSGEGTSSDTLITGAAATYLTAPVALDSAATPASPQSGEGDTTGPVIASDQAFINYEIVPGDTLLAIAERYGIGVEYLIWNNPEIGADPDSLIIGESLLVPATNGLVYDVRLGDTITDIAGTFATSPDAIISFAPNDLSSPDLITEGMVLLLPGGVPPPPPEPVAEPEAQPAAAEPPQDPVADPDPGFAVPAAAGPPIIESAPIAVDPGLYVSYIWPLNGTFWSGYGPRWGSFHKGIDIGAGYGTPIVAAAAGQVILSTYRDNGYGMYVIVRHADGSETLYAHMSQLYVSVGQYLNQGDALGAVGCTGWCSGDHLHFEVWIGGTTDDPLHYLP